MLRHKTRQQHEHARHAKESARWEQLPNNERKTVRPPMPPRGYFASDVTIEGLHADLHTHPTGGVALLLNEASSLLTSQGQYKAGKGADREAWLRLWDGNDVRIVRAGKTSYLHGARVQVAGGIQPAIFARVFASEDGMYLSDGTVFRGLFTYEPSTHFELTAESWQQESRQAWERILENALTWADSYREADPQTLRLSPAALELLRSWRNTRDALRPSLPPALRGFLPKSVSYALRLAGLLHCITAFAQDESPSERIDAPTLQRGVDVVEYYLGQAVDAVRLLTFGTTAPPVEASERTILLGTVLESLRGEIDNGRLAVGFIHARYNAAAPPEARMNSPHAMGSLLRSAGLTISDGRHHANGKIGVRCLEWNDKTEALIKASPCCPSCPQPEEACGVSGMDFQHTKSTKSTQPERPAWTSRTSPGQSPSPQAGASSAPMDFVDKMDFPAGSAEKTMAGSPEDAFATSEAGHV